MASFADFALLPTLQKTLLEQNLLKPTDIQRRALPALIEGKSLVGVAETGGGKTLCYALPILHRLKILEESGESVRAEAEPRAAVLVPTRDLGEQVAKVFKIFTHATRLRVRSVLGGTTLEVARRNIQGSFEVLVATPGRLIQLMDRGLLSLKDVRTLVFDEVDQMLDPGFLAHAQRIARDCPAERQTALFSATVSPAVQELIQQLLGKAPVLHSQGSHRLVPSLKTENRYLKDGKRLPLLKKLLSQPTSGGTLLFANTRQQCDELAAQIQNLGHACVVYRGEMDKVERRANLKLFREGKVPLLVSTDLASRGLDVEHVSRVINYHLPEQLENYIHRAGRTARAGREGLVINLVTERDRPLLQQLEKNSF